MLDFYDAQKAFRFSAGKVGFAPEQSKLIPKRTRSGQIVYLYLNNCTHRGWLERVWPAKHRVPRGDQLLEVPLQLVQAGAVVEGLRQWNVSSKVSENRLLLVD